MLQTDYFILYLLTQYFIGILTSMRNVRIFTTFYKSSGRELEQSLIRITFTAHLYLSTIGHTLIRRLFEQALFEVCR